MERLSVTPSLLTLLAVLALFVGVSQAYLTRRDVVNAPARGAVCLDGSPAAYYLFRNISSTRWIIHLETGDDVCFGHGAASCQLFSTRAGGSSRTWPCVLPELQAAAFNDVGRMVSSDARRNPTYVTANRVFVRHCSGDLFTGRRTRNPYNGLVFGGHNIVVAVLEDLVRVHGLNTAEQVLFGGAAPGALTHVDTLRNMLSASTLLAGYADGAGLRGFPGFVDLQPQISASEAANTLNNLSLSINVSASASLLALANTVRVVDPFIPASCTAMFGTTALAGLECFDSTVGAMFAVTGDAAVFVFASAWDTYVLSNSFTPEQFTCMQESRRVTTTESVFLAAVGSSAQEAMRALYAFGQGRGRAINVFLSNCYTSQFLEDDYLCSTAGGVSAYAAMERFITAALQQRSELIADVAVTTGRRLACSASCGAEQCAWDTNPFRSAADTATLCSSSNATDGFVRFRTGTACPGAAPITLAASSSSQSTLSRYDIVNATARNALCLDGSPASYYIHRNLASPNWIIHVQGGSFCTSQSECQNFIQTNQGSSSNFACTLPGNDPNNTSYEPVGRPVHGSPDINPAFWQWNRVHVRYCTGDSYFGRQPRATNAFGVNHLGHFVLQATFEDLTTFHGLLDGNFVLLGGTSAGAVGAQTHLDFFNQHLQQASGRLGRTTPRLFGYSDGGWFRGVPGLAEFAASPSTAFQNIATSPFVLNIRNLFAGVYNAYHDESCFANRSQAMPVFLGHDCLQSDILYPFIDVPVFMMSALWDTFDYHIRVGSIRASCAAVTGSISAVERAFLVQYGDYSLARYRVFQSRPQDGQFIPSCFSHSHFDFPLELNITASCADVNGVSPYEGLRQWVNYIMSGAVGSPPRFIGQSPSSPLQCTPGCLAAQCQFANNPDTANTSCPNLSAERNSPFADASLNFIGPPCAAQVTPPPTDAPPATTAQVMPACPSADAAATLEARYLALLDCWSLAFAQYQETFNRYVNNQCTGR